MSPVVLRPVQAGTLPLWTLRLRFLVAQSGLVGEGELLGSPRHGVWPRAEPKQHGHAESPAPSWLALPDLLITLSPHCHALGPF